MGRCLRPTRTSAPRCSTLLSTARPTPDGATQRPSTLRTSTPSPTTRRRLPETRATRRSAVGPVKLAVPETPAAAAAAVSTRAASRAEGHAAMASACAPPEAAGRVVDCSRSAARSSRPTCARRQRRHARAARRRGPPARRPRAPASPAVRMVDPLLWRGDVPRPAHRPPRVGGICSTKCGKGRETRAVRVRDVRGWRGLLHDEEPPEPSASPLPQPADARRARAQAAAAREPPAVQAANARWARARASRPRPVRPRCVRRTQASERRPMAALHAEATEVAGGSIAPIRPRSRPPACARRALIYRGFAAPAASHASCFVEKGPLRKESSVDPTHPALALLIAFVTAACGGSARPQGSATTHPCRAGRGPGAPLGRAREGR